MRFATIGTSGITKEFVSSAALAGGMEYAQAYSRSRDRAEAFARENGAQGICTSLDMMAADASIDAVYIASPNALHFEQSRMMLNAGKSVFCEKPLTVAPGECENLQTLAADKGVVYLEAIMSLYSPGLVSLRDNLPRIGNISGSHLDLSQLSSRYPLLRDGGLPNIFSLELRAGALMDMGVYNVYAALELFGYPQRIRSQVKFCRTGADISGCVLFEYPGQLAVLEYNKAAQSYTPSEIRGDLGSITIHSLTQMRGIELHTAQGSETLYPDNVAKPEIMKYETAFFRDTCERIRNGKDGGELYGAAQKISRDVMGILAMIRAQNSFPF